MTDEKVIVEDMRVAINAIKDNYRTLILHKLLPWYEYEGTSMLKSTIRLVEDKTEVVFRQNLNLRSVTIRWEEDANE
jgi:hypothetical protein